MKTLIAQLPFITISALMLTACGGGSSGGSGSGEVSVGVTDAAVDNAERVVVEFTSVELKPQGGESLFFELDSPQQIDLLSVQGSEFEPLLTSESVPAGPYNWIRLGVTSTDCSAALTGDMPEGSFIELLDGSLEPLHIPSGAQSGLKLNSGFTVAAGGQTNLTIDFDVRKSVTAPEGQDCHFLKPSLRLVDNAEIGHIAGTVDLTALDAERCGAGVAIYLFEGHDVVVDDLDAVEPNAFTSAIVDQETASYEIGYVLAGNYTAALTCDGELDDPEVDDAEVTFEAQQNVTVVIDDTVQADF